MNWNREYPQRTREESFQFWYRSIVLALLTAGIMGIAAIIAFQWDNSVDMAAVKVQLAAINTTMAAVPINQRDIAVLKQSNEDLKRRMENYEGVRNLK